MSKDIDKNLYDKEFWWWAGDRDLKTDEEKYAKFLMTCKTWASSATKLEFYDEGNIGIDWFDSIIKNGKIDYESIPGFTWDNTISFFELFCWFNQHYNEFIKEARKLPQLEATFKDNDTAKIVTRKFVFDRVPKDALGITPLMVFHEDYDKHKSWGNPTKRELSFNGLFGDRTVVIDNNAFAEYSCSNFSRRCKCEIDDDIYKAYVDLRNKYYDFLRVYSVLKNFNLGSRKIYATYIDAPNPFMKIKSFKLFLAGSTNEGSYMGTYKLSKRYPIFCGNNMGYHQCIGNDAAKSYDYIPKMTRIRRDRFDVNIDLSNIEFPELKEFDKQFVYVPKK